jgi:hypothetical protein
VKLLTGARVRLVDQDVFASGGVGVKYYPTPWLAFSTYLPYKWNVGKDGQTARRVDLAGLGDLSLGVSFDLRELLMPTMIRTHCPETGGPILALKDDDDLVKSGHLILTAGASAPTGKSDHAARWWYYPAQYQPGSGVWTGSAGLFYGQGIGPFTPGVGISYIFGGGINPAGYDKPDSMLFTASFNWMFWPGRLGRLFAAINAATPLGKGRVDGKALAGSNKTMVLADLGVALWAGSFWRKSRKITVGLAATIPVVEGANSTEPRNGYSIGVFSTFGL